MLGKNDKPKKNKAKSKGNRSYLILLIIAGSLLFGVVTWTVISANRSITAIVPAQTIAPGTTITPNMIKAIDIPANTPTGYITDENSLIGQKVKIQVSENQMLYPTDVQTSYNIFGNNVEIPKNFVLTSLNIPDDRALSGLISAGDNVDIAGVPTSNFVNAEPDDMEKYLGGIFDDKFGANGINGYWILGNVKILQSFKSQAEQEQAQAGDDAAAQSQSGVEQGSYVVALSYADYKKVLISQQYLDFYMNIGPKSGFNPELMKDGDGLNSLLDAQKQDGNKDLGKKKKKEDKTDKTEESTEETTESSK